LILMDRFSPPAWGWSEDPALAGLAGGVFPTRVDESQKPRLKPGAETG